MIDLFKERLKRMNDHALMVECLSAAREMESGVLTDDQKTRFTSIFNEALSRPVFDEQRDVLEAAIKVIHLL